MSFLRPDGERNVNGLLVKRDGNVVRARPGRFGVRGVGASLREIAAAGGVTGDFRASISVEDAERKRSVLLVDPQGHVSRLRGTRTFELSSYQQAQIQAPGDVWLTRDGGSFIPTALNMDPRNALRDEGSMRVRARDVLITPVEGTE